MYTCFLKLASAMLVTFAATLLAAADPVTRTDSKLGYAGMRPIEGGAHRFDETDQLKFFESKVRPLLIQRCFQCHAADTHKGELRVDSRESLLTGGASGVAIVPGNVDESLLIQAVRYESLEMPPDDQLAPAEIDILVHWVNIGAPWPQANSPPFVGWKQRIADRDRKHWAFSPVQAATAPQVDDQGSSRNDLDRFIFARLTQEGLTPSQPAEREALIRRVYFDLIGLPPCPEEIDQFVADDSMGAYQRLVGRLLASPQHGERWARHWLDLVRYAESDGYKQDAYRPNAWRYRDYVVRAFNDDKPYDQFVIEQLAGDEIAPDDPDAIVATGYLRSWIYEYNQRDVRTQWDTILDDITDVTGDVFLGMGMGCARCHDHKFDPILRDNYYRLRAFFAPLVPRDDMPIATPGQVARHQSSMRLWEQKTAELRRKIAEIERPILARATLPAINRFPPDIRAMMLRDPANRTPRETQLADLVNRQVAEETSKLDMAGRLEGEQKKLWESLRKQLAEFAHLKPQPLPRALSVTDVGSAAPPTIIPGDTRRREIAPGYLTVLAPGDAVIKKSRVHSNSTGRRTALARWIASPENPLSTRVIVNRVWQYTNRHAGRRAAWYASHGGAST